VWSSAAHWIGTKRSASPTIDLFGRWSTLHLSNLTTTIAQPRVHHSDSKNFPKNAELDVYKNAESAAKHQSSSRTPNSKSLRCHYASSARRYGY